MDIVVIGAGLSGLIAASILKQAGINVTVVEGHEDVGGRIRSLKEQKNGRVLADLGPTWVWPKYQPVVARWLKDLGIATFEQFNEGDAIVTGYGPMPIRQPLPGQDGIARVLGGPSALVDALAKAIGAESIHTAIPVAGISEDGRHHVEIRFRNGECISADKAIVAIPLRVAATSLHIPWADQALLDAMRGAPTWMSTHAKAVVLYDRPFWREAGLSGRIASRIGPLVEAHDHSGLAQSPAGLFGFVGWSPEERNEDIAGLKQAIVDQLIECFGEEAKRPLEIVVQDWARDHFVVSDLDLAEPPEHPQIGPRILRQWHLDGRVRFAVSEASGLSPGLIEGALAAGEQAALSILTNGS